VKPDVLSDEELEKLLGVEFETEYSGHVRDYRNIAQAQLDVDVAYYKPIIQQAKAEVAREIIEIAKREVKYALRQELFKIPSYKQQDAVAHNLGSRLEAALKDKYLKEAA